MPITDSILGEILSNKIPFAQILKLLGYFDELLIEKMIYQPSNSKSKVDK